MTQEDFETLIPFEKNLMSAYKSNEITALTSKDVLTLAVVGEHYGLHLDNKNCGRCILGLCRALGEMFANYIPHCIEEPKISEQKDVRTEKKRTAHRTKSVDA